VYKRCKRYIPKPIVLEPMLQAVYDEFVLCWHRQ
jgi:hypothetical protein